MLPDQLREGLTFDDVLLQPLESSVLPLNETAKWNATGGGSNSATPRALRHAAFTVSVS